MECVKEQCRFFEKDFEKWREDKLSYCHLHHQYIGSGATICMADREFRRLKEGLQTIEEWRE